MVTIVIDGALISRRAQRFLFYHAPQQATKKGNGIKFMRRRRLHWMLIYRSRRTWNHHFTFV
jgi:hypothetical protein